MVTDNQKTMTTVVLLAAVLLVGFVPLSHAIPFVLADKSGLLTGFGHATTSLAFASHKQGVFNGFGHATTSTSLSSFKDRTQGQWSNQDPYQGHQQQHYKKWHSHSSSGYGIQEKVVNVQNADCTSTSNANGGNANGGTGGSGNGGNGGPSNGGSGGTNNDHGTGANGASGGFSGGGNGGNLPGGPGGTGGPSSATSQTSCSNTSTFHISNPA
jgi:hypothetical protein